LAETAKVEVGVVPVAEGRLSQVPPLGVVAAAALNVTPDPPLAVTLTFCDSAVVLPAVAVKESGLGLTVSVGRGGGPVLAAGIM
jgi:hypothetical protein